MKEIKIIARNFCEQTNANVKAFQLEDSSFWKLTGTTLTQISMGAYMATRMSSDIQNKNCIIQISVNEDECTFFASTSYLRRLITPDSPGYFSNISVDVNIGL